MARMVFGFMVSGIIDWVCAVHGSGLSGDDLLLNARLQRLRLCPGWNLLSVAVTAPDLAGQFEQNSPGLVQLIYQWDPSSGSYSAVSPGQTVSTGAVLWVKAVANATIGIVGAYAEPSIPHVQTGGSYLAGRKSVV